MPIAAWAPGAATAGRRPAKPVTPTPAATVSSTAGDPTRNLPAASAAPAPRYPPPPHPPEIDGFVHGPRHMEDRVREQDLQRIGAGIDKRFGPDFPADKREKLLQAQLAWDECGAESSWDYYNGYISKDESLDAVHRCMVRYMFDCEAALTPDEYRRWSDLDPNVDPYLILTDFGALAGTSMGVPHHQY